MRVGIVGQRRNPRAAHLAERLLEELSDGIDVLVDERTAEAIDVAGTPPDRMPQLDLAVSIGGDGTFLYAARAFGTTPILGVNLGEVGFLNAISPEDALEVVRTTVEELETGRLATREVPRLRARGDDWTLDPAINEIVVQGPRRGPGSGAGFEVRIDGSLYTGGQADGVLVATPTGSTAYNLSEGGPLIHPSVRGMIVNEMCATEGLRPLVVAPDATVEIRFEETSRGYAIGDGRDRQPLESPAMVRVTLADEPLRLAGPEIDFFEALGKLQ